MTNKLERLSMYLWHCGFDKHFTITTVHHPFPTYTEQTFKTVREVIKKIKSLQIQKQNALYVIQLDGSLKDKQKFRLLRIPKTYCWNSGTWG